jgi:hypothetical protein
MILTIGRRLKLESPSMIDVNLFPASNPLSIRIVEPELPAKRSTGSDSGA